MGNHCHLIRLDVAYFGCVYLHPPLKDIGEQCSARAVSTTGSKYRKQYPPKAKAGPLRETSY